jgi:acyl-CoA synthetase (AMP-forming)/AMP-acid ligase II
LKHPFREGELEVLPIWRVESDEDERLSISGAALFRGYLFQKDGSLRYESLDSGSFLTNDRVRVVGNHLKPLGRMDSLVKVLGVLVDIEEVERRFLEVAGGRVSAGKFAVIALPDLRKEHVLVAFFEGEIPAGCVEDYQRLASGLEQFEQSFCIDEFPRSSLGKIRRGELMKACERLRKE